METGAHIEKTLDEIRKDLKQVSDTLSTIKSNLAEVSVQIRQLDTKLQSHDTQLQTHANDLRKLEVQQTRHASWLGIIGTVAGMALSATIYGIIRLLVG